jgi:hypothetical protein
VVEAAAQRNLTQPGAAGDDPQSLLRELDDLAWLLDSRWRVPGTSFRFGVDAVAGLIPGLGDAATALPSAYMVWRAREFGLPSHVLARMVGNVALDFAIGAIPVVGSLFDFAFKANRRNVKLLRRHLERRSGRN